MKEKSGISRHFIVLTNKELNMSNIYITMPGGLMNLVSSGAQNVILNSNPSKSFYKASYAKYTNFGLQKFRIDFEGTPTLRLAESSVFTFKMKRYADLLMDCYLSIDLPDIWSPIARIPVTNTYTKEIKIPYEAVTNNFVTINGPFGIPYTIDEPTMTTQYTTTTFTSSSTIIRRSPYDFKWIENIGSQIISKITITCGNQTIQEFSGEYLLAATQRDFSAEKKALFDRMTGNIPELFDPANADGRNNIYPNAKHIDGNEYGAEPSIRGRTIYVPLNAWFTMKSQMAFPLVALQYNELVITVTLRPIQELFRIRDIMDSSNNYPYVAPNFNKDYMQFYRFLQTPPPVDPSLGTYIYTDKRSIWNSDINLNCTYCFLSNAESRLFAIQEQNYLFRQVRENKFLNITGSNKLDLKSLGLVSSYLFFLRRSDANLRNECSNYTNWPYGKNPVNEYLSQKPGRYDTIRLNTDGSLFFSDPIDFSSNNLVAGFLTTGPYNHENEKTILREMALLLDGTYRENSQSEGVYNYIEKYTRTSGNAPDGLYCYNFCLNTNPHDLQPSGAMNMNRFHLIELEISTISPPFNPKAQVTTICDPLTGVIIGINKPAGTIYMYGYDLTVFEERHNVVSFVGGNAALMYAT